MLRNDIGPRGEADIRRAVSALAEMPLLWIGIAALMAAIFVADTVTSYEIAAAVLYVAAILLSMRAGRPLAVLAVGVLSAALTVASFLLTVGGLRQQGLANGALSLVAIACTTVLAMRMQQAEVRIRQGQADLAHMARITLLGELAASIAHEVSQPLAGIGASANAASRWLDGAVPNIAEARDALALVLRDAERARDVVGRIRSLAGKVQPAPAPFDLVAAIQEVLLMVRGQLWSHQISLRTELADDLPEPVADRIQVQQVVLNLVVNAIEALGSVGTDHRDLLVSAAANDRTITVSVRDTGPGLSDAKLARAFDAFYSTKPEGMGMGLAISRSIVEAHGGTIYAAHNHPRGVVFGFTLPIRRSGARHG